MTNINTQILTKAINQLSQYVKEIDNKIDTYTSTHDFSDSLMLYNSSNIANASEMSNDDGKNRTYFKVANTSITYNKTNFVSLVDKYDISADPNDTNKLAILPVYNTNMYITEDNMFIDSVFICKPMNSLLSCDSLTSAIGTVGDFADKTVSNNQSTNKTILIKHIGHCLEVHGNNNDLFPGTFYRYFAYLLAAIGNSYTHPTNENITHTVNIIVENVDIEALQQNYYIKTNPIFTIGPNGDVLVPYYKVDYASNTIKPTGGTSYVASATLDKNRLSFTITSTDPKFPTG